MPITLKKDVWKVKDPSSGQYRGAAILSTTLPQDAAQIISESNDTIQNIKDTAIDAVDTALNDESTGLIPKAEADRDAIDDSLNNTTDGIIPTAQSDRDDIDDSLNNIEDGIIPTAQANLATIAQAVQSQIGQGTDKTLSVAKGFADAKAAGMLVKVSDYQPGSALDDPATSQDASQNTGYPVYKDSNRVWVKETYAELEVPTMDDVDELKNTLDVLADYAPLTIAFDGMRFTQSDTIAYGSYVVMGYADVSGLSYVRVVKHPLTRTFEIAFTKDATRPDRGSVIYSHTYHTSYSDVVVEVPDGATYVCALIYNENESADAAVGKDASKAAFLVYDVTALDKKVRSELSEYITESEPLLSSIGDMLIKTHGIERTGWNYYNEKVEDYPNSYWYGSTVGSAIHTEVNNIYRAVLIPVESVIYTTSSTPRFVHYLDADKLLLRIDTDPTTMIDNTAVEAAFLALTLYMSTTNFVLQKDGEKGYEEYTGRGAWVFDNLEQETVLHHYLPSEICCAVGRTIELYNNLVCLEADKYHVHWACDVGTTFERKFSVTGAASNVGNYTLVMNLYDDNMNLIASYGTTLKIVNPSITTQLKGVPIGDSLTNQKAWIPEVQNLSGNKIKFIGTRGYSDSTYNQEGRSGASSSWYVSNSSYTFEDHYIGNPNVPGSSNPFWDGIKFSLSHYNTMQSAYIGGTPEFVVILLGINGLSFDNTTNVSNIKTMVDNIRAEYPTLPVFVCNTPYRSNQNGYYSIGSDGYQSVADFQFSSDTKIMDLQNKIEDTFSEYSNVYIVPMSLCMDREYDYGNIPTPVNPRLADITIDIPSESVHPQLPGYYQMADALWSSIATHLIN